MKIELFDPNDISLGVVTMVQTGRKLPKMRSFENACKIVSDAFCRAYKEWDGTTDIIGQVIREVDTVYSIILVRDKIDYEIYACR